jgi:hypothetical protein
MFTKFDEINRIADDAWLAVTGASRDELLEKFYDPIWGKRRVPPALETETELCTACGQRIPIDRYSFGLKGSARGVT